MIMSSSMRRNKKNGMEKGVLGLNDDDIQEELLNADLKALGINEDDLNNMETQEKLNLLTALKQSTNQQQDISFQQNKQAPSSNNDDPVSCGSSPNPRSVSDKNEIDISIDSPEEYPSLPSPSNKQVIKEVTYGKRNNQYQRNPSRPQQKVPYQQQNQYQQPKKQPVEVITVNSNQDECDDDDDDDDDEEVEEEDDEEVEEEEEDDEDDDQSFNFPNFVDDNGFALKQHARKKPMLRYIQYYRLPMQSSKDSIKTMLKHYNAWYKTWCSLEKHNILPDESNVFIANLMRRKSKQDSIPSTSVLPETSVSCSTKVSNNTCNNERPIPFGKSSSPDVEEIEVTEIKTAETPRLTPNPKATTLPRETRVHNLHTPSSSSSPTIALNFEEKWDPESRTWTNPRKRNSMNNRTGNSGYGSPGKEPHFQPKESIKIVEAKVQCPICQLDFLQSKVEGHAAVCEGFPTETRSNQSSHSSKTEESNSKDGCKNSTVVELTNSESMVANKKRVAENEDNQSSKRMCVNSIKS